MVFQEKKRRTYNPEQGEVNSTNGSALYEKSIPREYLDCMQAHTSLAQETLLISTSLLWRREDGGGNFEGLVGANELGQRQENRE